MNVAKVVELIGRVEVAIAKAETGVTKLTAQQFSIGGMSAKKNRIFLNELIKPDTNYLEIGIHKGSTFISALYGNRFSTAFAIDNYSQFAEGPEVMSLIHGFINTCIDNEIENHRFIMNDCFNLHKFEKAQIKNIDVYFYDGAHEEEPQAKALTYYKDNLADAFIYIVDDWNFSAAQTGTFKGIAECEFKVVKSWELKADTNGDEANWWNGLYVAVIQKSDPDFDALNQLLINTGYPPITL